MRAYVINLEAATDRWEYLKKMFAGTGISLSRVDAVNGKTLDLPHKNFDETRFRAFHGRGTNPYEIACYWSHIKAMRAFLETEESHALICEDDLAPGPKLDAVITEALTYQSHWNILRLTGLSAGTPVQIAQLETGHHLCVHLGRLKGAGAYIVDRKAATAFVKNLLPMWLPYDHAFDREWFQGLSALAVAPFPVSQTDNKFRSSIQKHSTACLTSPRRWVSTYPYQIFNECGRWIFRGAALVAWKTGLRRHHMSGGASVS